MPSSVQNTILGIFGLILVGFAYFLFKPADILLQNNTSPLEDQILIKTQAFITNKEMLDAISLDTTILTDSRLVGLVDNSTPLENQTLGKDSLFERPASLLGAKADTGTASR